MKRYVSLAGAMLLGTVVAQEKKAAFKGEVAVKAEAVELKEAAVATAAIALEGTKPVYRSEASPFMPDEVERNNSRVSKKSPAVAAEEDRRTSKVTSRATSIATSSFEVEKREGSSVTSFTPPEDEVNTSKATSNISSDSAFTPEVEVDEDATSNGTSNVTSCCSASSPVNVEYMSEYTEYNYDDLEVEEFSHYTENTFNTFDVQDRYDSRYTDYEVDRFTSRFTRYSPQVEDYSPFDYDTPRVNNPSRYSDFTPSYREDSYHTFEGNV